MTDGGVDATPVTYYVEEDEEESEEDPPLIVNKRVYINPMPKYNEAAFMTLFSHTLNHPRYDTNYCSGGAYDSSQGYRYCREVSKDVYEDITNTLSDGDSLEGLYRIENVEYVFDHSAYVTDSAENGEKYLAATVIPVFKSNDNMFASNNVECETYVINPDATKKYAFAIDLSDSSEYVRIGVGRYRLPVMAICTFETGTFSFDLGEDATLDAQFVKGWNRLVAILEANEDGNFDLTDMVVESMSTDELPFLDTKADGIAGCEYAVQQTFFADALVTDLTVLENGFYRRAGGLWNFIGSITADNAKRALALAQAISGNAAINKLTDGGSVLLYNGQPVSQPLEELTSDETDDEYSQVASNTIWSISDTTEYYARQTYTDISRTDRVKYLPMSKFLDDGQDISHLYTRSSRYDYRMSGSNRSYCISTPDVENTDVYLHFPDFDGANDAGLKLYLYYPTAATIHWGRVCFSGGSVPSLTAGHCYLVDAQYNAALGMWALTVTDYDTRNIDTTGVPAEQKTLENCTWEEIAAISANGWYDDNTGMWCTGDVSDPVGWFEVGDEKEVTLTDGTTITLQIYGFAHDEVGAGMKAGITFGLKNAMPMRSLMNTSDTNRGGWRESFMRNNTIAGVYELLPQEVKDVLLTVRKKTTKGSYDQDVEVTYDKVFLFSAYEVDSSADYVYRQEGTTYPIFTDETSRIKTLGEEQDASPVWWWLRSPNGNDRHDFRYVTDSGWSGKTDAYRGGGVVFGFCV